MKKSRFSEAQIVAILQQQQSGQTVAHEALHQHQISIELRRLHHAARPWSAKLMKREKLRDCFNKMPTT